MALLLGEQLELAAAELVRLFSSFQKTRAVVVGERETILRYQ
jgi:hypothetical protein